VLSPQAENNDEILARLAPGSLVINATGLGKDAPGSPLSPLAQFPENGIVWDLNYRGDLVFLEQARQQKNHVTLVEDGWIYFLHGWTQGLMHLQTEGVHPHTPFGRGGDDFLK
jgi:shikimate 5-dehydrogenase